MSQRKAQSLLSYLNLGYVYCYKLLASLYGERHWVNVCLNDFHSHQNKFIFFRGCKIFSTSFKELSGLTRLGNHNHGSCHLEVFVIMENFFY